MKIITPFFLIILLTLISCNPSEKESGDFKILPLPQYQVYKGIGKLIPQDVTYVYCKENIPLPVRGALLSHLEPVRKKALSQVICSIDSSIDVREQGYILKISKKRVVVTGRDQQGLFYGLMTLEQIMRDAIDQDIALPLCHIEDYPLLSWRAIHLDLKHHREKLDYYYRLIDKLASYKINAIIAEMEDKLGYVRQPEVASDDAISIEEWRALSDYAQERNIEISPLIQGLGHASFILKHDKYKHLRDDPKDDWAFNPLDPETYEVQFDLYRDAMEAIPYGRYLHVGGDEVHTTGRNSGMSSLELQLIWLNKVCEFAAQHDRIPVPEVSSGPPGSPAA